MDIISAEDLLAIIVYRTSDAWVDFCRAEKVAMMDGMRALASTHTLTHTQIDFRLLPIRMNIENMRKIAQKNT